MSQNISLTAENWYGTQMKPDIYEPATAEWAGRGAMNAGWLFYRQQQALFSESKLDRYYIETPEETFQQVFQRRFWLNELFGEFVLITLLAVEAAETVLSGTLSFGFANTAKYPIGAFDGTYTTSGWKGLYLYVDEPNGWRIHEEAYGQLCLYAKNTGGGKSCRLSYCSFTGLPR